MIRAGEITDHTGALRAHTDWRRYLATYHSRLAPAWLADRAHSYGREAAVASAIGFAHMVEDTVGADVCWMTAEMMDLVKTASEGFDATEPFLIADAFIPHGFLVLPKPWYSIDVNNETIGQRAYLWRVDPYGCVLMDDGTGSYSYDLNRADEGTVEPTLRVTTLSHIDDPDSHTEHMDDLSGETWSEWMVKNGWCWGVVHTTAIPFSLVSSMRDVTGVGDLQAGWLTFWRVAQRLMSERIVTSERRQAARPARRDAQRDGFDPGAPRVIELRRPTERESDPERERVGHVEWTHRWIVGGHWRNQWFPSEGRHKQIRIPAHEKGPKDKPLVIRERVWNWDR